MFKKILLTLSFSFALIYSISSFAALTKSSGAYLEANIGFDNHTDLTESVNLGYKLNDYLGAEIGGAFFSDSKYYYDVAAKGMVPFANGFDVFAKAGLAEAHANDTYRPTIYLGVGTSYAFTTNLSGVLQYNSTLGNDDVTSLQALTIGLSYIF